MTYAWAYLDRLEPPSPDCRRSVDVTSWWHHGSGSSDVFSWL